MTRMRAALEWLRRLIARRKWILWVAIVILVLIFIQIAVSFIPHHDLSTFSEFEEKSNGGVEVPHGAREDP
jgi:hypothetical protein